MACDFMQKCYELSRLPKAGRISSLLVRRQRPGLVTKIHPDTRLVDPRHPAARNQRLAWTTFRSPTLMVSAIPSALLERPQVQSEPFIRNYKTWGNRNDKMASSEPRRIPMSFWTVITIKSTHKATVIRWTIHKRLLTALNLIVARGATGVNHKGERKVEMNEENSLGRLILADWTYVFRPGLEIYRMPWANLIDLLSSALGYIHRVAKEKDSRWKYTPDFSKEDDKFDFASTFDPWGALGFELDIPEIFYKQPMVHKRRETEASGIEITKVKMFSKKPVVLSAW